MSEVEESLQNFPSSLAYYKKFTAAKDSVFNAENTRVATEMRLGFEFEKKQQADSLQTVQKNKIYELTIERQRTFTYLVLAVLFLLVVVLYLLFRHRNRISIEKKRSEDLLLNILPVEVANSLKEKGEALPQQYEHVTVLFTDFVGFSQISEKLSARELVDEIHLCFSAFDEIITRHGLEKIKTIGDAYLAVSGLPHEENEHALKVVKAAQELISFTEKRKKEGGKFNVRIGIHSGPVVAGIVGTRKFAYDIWGDTVNTASRMESHGESGRVCISATTYHLIKNQIKCSSRGIIQVKGKGPMELFFVDH
jgi:class 3 adenylate cyclase